MFRRFLTRGMSELRTLPFILLAQPYFWAMFSTVGFEDYPKVVLNLRMRYTLIGSLIRNVTVSV